jgi:hypothetical protein
VFAGWPDASAARFGEFGASWEGAVRDAGCFAAIERAVFPWAVAYTHERFRKLLATFSWAQTVPGEARAALFRAIEAALARAADPLPLHMHTLLGSAVAIPPGDTQFLGP